MNAKLNDLMLTNSALRYLLKRHAPDVDLAAVLDCEIRHLAVMQICGQVRQVDIQGGTETWPFYLRWIYQLLMK